MNLKAIDHEVATHELQLIEAMQKKCHALKSNYQSLQSQNQILKTNLESSKKESIKSQKIISNLTAKNSELERLLSDIFKENSRLVSSLEECKNSVLIFREETETKLDSLNSENTGLRSENKKLRETLVFVRDEQKKWGSQNDEEKRELVFGFEEEIRRLKVVLTEKETEYMAERGRNENQVRVLEGETDRLRREIESMRQLEVEIIRKVRWPRLRRFRRWR